MMLSEIALNPAFKAPELIKSFSNHFSNQTPCETNDFEIVKEPFLCMILRNLVADADSTLPVIEKVLRRSRFIPKNNDLYSFKQSADLSKTPKPLLTTLRNFFLNDVLSWVKSATDIPLNEGCLDICASLYENHDVLLCHDDELEGRRVAFVWYLVPEDWSEADGGHLDVFSSDNKCSPLIVQRSFLPKRNSLMLFEVSPRSWHQVREVLSSARSRLSVNGWFRGPPLPRPGRETLPSPTFLSPTEIEEGLMYSWVRQQYLVHAIQSQIHDSMLEDSQVLLTDFLFEEKYQLLRDALRGSEMEWSRVWVPHVRCLDLPARSGDDLPDPIRAVLRLFASDAMMVVLADMTGLSLHPAARRMQEEEKETKGKKGKRGRRKKKTTKQQQKKEAADDGPPSKKARSESTKTPGTCCGELRRWSHGCYTLLSDSDLARAALDVSLFVSCESWSEKVGGFHSYIAKNEDEELLCVEPTANALALVYRDEETLQFVKYVSSAVEKLNVSQAFYDFSFLYLEPREDE